MYIESDNTQILIGGDDLVSMADDLKNSKCNGYKKGEEPCPCEKFICEGDKICYNNKNCCY